MRRVVGVDGIRYVGEHGLELEPEAERWAYSSQRFAAAPTGPSSGKRLSLSFHYRERREGGDALSTSRRSRQRARERRVSSRAWGRKVLDIRPPVDADKGTAVRSSSGKRG